MMVRIMPQSDSEKLKQVLALDSELNKIQDLDILLERILYEARKVVNAIRSTTSGRIICYSVSRTIRSEKRYLPAKAINNSSK
jgi:hypothetical protein